MKRFLREPLLHFVILGALLFALYSSLNKGTDAPDEIIVSSGQIENMRTQFFKVWRREPTHQEMAGLIDSWVREEVLYREGLAMGLDQNDQVIRRRVMQKIEFLAEGTTPEVPTDPALQSWLNAHPDDYRIEPRYTLTQVYFDPSRHAGTLEADVASARMDLLAGRDLGGDSTLLPSDLQDQPTSEIARTFGNRFSESLDSLPTGQWSEPVTSGFGVHLVRVTNHQDGRAARLDEVRGAVERDYLHDQTHKGNEAFYTALKQKYSIRIEQPEPTGAPSAAVQ